MPLKILTSIEINRIVFKNKLRMDLIGRDLTLLGDLLLSFVGSVQKYHKFIYSGPGSQSNFTLWPYAALKFNYTYNPSDIVM